MPPKAAIGPDEDVKFLLTIIKQLEGTVSLSALPMPHTKFAALASSAHNAAKLRKRR